MRRVVPWLLVAALVVAAGCGSLTGDQGAPGTGQTVTPVSVPTTSTTPTPSTVAPGLAADRIVNASALLDRHAAVLSASSHTYRERVTKRYPNGTVWRESTTLVQRNQSAVRYRHNWTRATGNASRSVDRWRSGDRWYVARTDGATTTVTVANGTTEPSVPGASSGYAPTLDRTLRLLNVTVTGVEYRDGRRRYRLETTEPRVLSPSRNLTFVGYVTPEGVFTEYRLSYRIVRRTVRVDVTIVATFEQVDSTTVTRPPWADRVRVDTADE